MAVKAGKISEFFDIKALQTEVAKVDKIVTDLYDKLSKQAVNISITGDAVKGAKGVQDTTMAIQEQNKMMKENARLLEQQAAMESELAQKNMELKIAIREQNKAKEEQIRLAKLEKDSLAAVDILIRQKTAQYEKMSKAQRDNATALRDEIKALQDQRREMRTAMGDMKANVGNYTESIKKAGVGGNSLSGIMNNLKESFKKQNEAAGQMEGTMTGIKQVFMSMPGPIGQVSAAFERLAGMLKLGMIGVGLAALAGVIYGITKAAEMWQKRNDDIYESHIKILRSLAQIREEWRKTEDEIKKKTENRTQREQEYSDAALWGIQERAKAQKKYLTEVADLERKYGKEGQSNIYNDKIQQEKLRLAVELQNQTASINAAVAADMAKTDEKVAKSKEKTTKAAGNYKDSIQLLEDEIKRLTQTANDQVVAGDKSYEQTVRQIEKLKELKSTYENLIVSMQDRITLENAIAQNGISGPTAAAPQALNPKAGASIQKPIEGEVDSGSFNMKSQLLDQQNADQNAANNLGKEAAIWQQRFQMAAQFQSQIDALVQMSFDSRLMQLDKEAQQDEINKQKELERAKGNRNEINAINKRYDEKEKEREKEKRRIEVENAKYRKTSGIIGAVINTAMGVTGMLAQAGTMGVAAIVLAVLTGLLGAAEVALIASQPVPSYSAGRKGGPAEFAITGDKYGREAIVTKDGKTILTPDRPTLTFLPEGASVIPNKDLHMAASMGFERTMPTLFDLNFRRLEEKTDITNEHLQRIAAKKGFSLHITEKGLRKVSEDGLIYEQYLNNNIRL